MFGAANIGMAGYVVDAQGRRRTEPSAWTPPPRVSSQGLLYLLIGVVVFLGALVLRARDAAYSLDR